MPRCSRLFFYRDAAETMLKAGETDAAERFADALEAYTSAEPLPWSQFVIRRVRAPAALRRQGPLPGHLAEIADVRTEAARARLIVMLPDLDAALAAAGVP